MLLSDFNENCIFWTEFGKILQHRISMKVRSVGADLFHADGQTDVTKLIVTILKFANVPNTDVYPRLHFTQCWPIDSVGILAGLTELAFTLPSLQSLIYFFIYHRTCGKYSYYSHWFVLTISVQVQLKHRYFTVAFVQVISRCIFSLLISETTAYTLQKTHCHFFFTKTSPLTLRRLMSYIYGAPILDVSRSHTTTQHSR